MKAIVFPDVEQTTVQDVDRPSCGPDDVLVKVVSAGICGTDLHIFRGEYMSSFPLTPGHEFHGEVVEVGDRVQRFRVGDRVTVDPNLYCGKCENCLNQHFNHCLNMDIIGVNRSGAFAEYVVAPERACYALPAQMSAKQATFVEPLACVVYALQRMHVNPADRVLIVGVGPMGLLLVQALRHSGASLIAVMDKQPHRLEMAQSMGANAAVVANDQQDKNLKALSPQGFDVVIDATGVPAVIENAFRYLKPRGQFLQFGVAPIGQTIQISPYDIFRNDWKIIGSFALCYTFQPAIDWLANGVIDVEPLVSHCVPLDDFAEALDMFARGQTLKVHLDIGSS
ncbi:zinc-dependent alcohol dehydrogenase family protein [Phototrophicus methaneseepsis]|uniref:Zinc-dependent alcohol dehydrogenase family protein n=1 Tax=Phototrophicus methaneseepsis TaxID=2710758 RepID=A0A7S8IFC4_9CHLR|nr:zinc-dependent alcohol dehydrogenase family protein [Phototrophicus methaneseepsis]QPC83354.1 zinc-dependent alcohol dehydrogenase family protein [Phototrophicus methaneseepsis]